MPRVLFVISAADRWTLADGSTHPTGYWAEEVATPHRVFRDAGWDITLATPGGARPTVDKKSLGIAGGLPGKRRKIEAYLGGIADDLAHPVPLEDVDADEYDVVFYPGGHGPMEDLAYDATSGRLLADRLTSGKPLGMLCHAPAAINAAPLVDGRSPFAGRRMTGFSNREEAINLFARKAKWLMQDKVEELGVDYSRNPIPMRPYVVVDGNLFTGQNPQSGEELAQKLVAAAG